MSVLIPEGSHYGSNEITKPENDFGEVAFYGMMTRIPGCYKTLAGPADAVHREDLGYMHAGEHTMDFTAAIPSGIYFYFFSTGNTSSDIKKLIVL